MAKLLLIWRVALKDIRRRPVQALLSLLDPGFPGTTINPYARSRLAAGGPDVVATFILLPGGEAVLAAAGRDPGWHD
jgi:hypothetical protein